MRKQTKLVAVASAAALLALGASMTSFAGWEIEDGTYVYYDKDGYRVTETWKKAGDNWYWLDEDGYMATNRLIENGDQNGNIYYVGEDGAMVTNQWVELENDEYYDNDDEDVAPYNWYYFQASGKAYASTGNKFKTINGKKYAFDENGKMQYGWLDASGQRLEGDDAYITGVYYCGGYDDGAQVKNEWRELYVGDDGPNVDSEDDFEWFYFNNKGKKLYKGDAFTDENGVKRVNGAYYMFGEDGVMLSGWQGSVATASELTGSFSNNGARRKGWFKAVPSSKIDAEDNNNDVKRWFYALNDGTVVTSEVKTINGKKYAFDEDGEMLSGLVALELDGTTIVSCDVIDTENEMLNLDEYDAVYYFGTEEDGAMKTGNQTVNVDGENYQFAFDKEGADKGQGLKGKNGNAIYVNGMKVKADADYRYQVVSVDGEIQDDVPADYQDGEYYVINAAGTIMRGTTYKNTDGLVYTVGSNDQAVKAAYAD